MTDRPFLTSTEAAQRLGISKATLYAYVSRGLLTSRPADNSRSRVYLSEEVEGLARRKQERSDPESAARRAMDWGTPILDSSISLIAEDDLFYRGYRATDLAFSHRYEEVASLLWTDSFTTEMFDQAPPVHDSPFDRAIDRITHALTVAQAEDMEAYDLSGAELVRTAARITRIAADAFATGAGPTVGDRLAEGLALDEPHRRLLEAGLIVCADHELNVSAFAARCAASAEATLYGVVLAGLATIRGRKHAGIVDRIDAIFREAGAPGQLDGTLAARRRRGDAVVGFGHPLYGRRDPRAVAIMNYAETQWPDSVEVAFWHAANASTAARAFPTIDLALVLAGRLIGVGVDGALAIFALGRIAGWIAHAMEQYESGKLIRPRANYVGPRPRL